MPEWWDDPLQREAAERELEDHIAKTRQRLRQREAERAALRRAGPWVLGACLWGLMVLGVVGWLVGWW
jgi:fatty acid desaturase